MGARLMAIVAHGDRTKLYLNPTDEAVDVAYSAKPDWKPSAPSRGTWASNAQGRRYGFRIFGDYFTPRQLVALNTFCELVTEARERVRQDAIASGLAEDGQYLRAGGIGATAYSESIAVYLALAVDRCADYYSTLGRWQHKNQQLSNMFSRQAIPMVWDYPEANPFSGKGGKL